MNQTTGPQVTGQPTGNGARNPVLAIAAVAIVTIAGLFIWDGGGSDLAAPDRGGLGTGADPGVVGPGTSPGGGDAAGQLPGSGTPPGTDGPGTSIEPPPFDHLQLAPPGGRMLPKRFDTDRTTRWVVDDGDWRAVLQRYRDAFPVPGWRLADRIRAGGTRTEGYDIVPVEDPTSIDTMGVLVVSQHDREGTQTEVVYEPPHF